MTPRIICLLPARNAAGNLPALLESAPSFCDAIVALDDGSTDETGAILADHPLVEVVLTNPRRETYFGWHDGTNRNRLLAAATDLAPDWIISVDADERVDPADGAALRSFVAADALAGIAYGFRLFRMLSEETYDPKSNVVHRLFAYRPGQRFRDTRLGCTPIPETIPNRARIRTTLRIQDFGDAGSAGRRLKLEKHREADPQGEFRHLYERFRPVAPGPHPRWAPRPADLPVLERAAAPAPARPEAVGPGTRRTTVVCLLSARDCEQDLPGWFDSVGDVADAVVALDDGSTDRTAELLEAEPRVKIVLRNPPRVGYRGWDDSANRNRLLAAASELDPDWILFLDADERIAEDDKAALRRFIDEEAEPGCAYGFPMFRMIGDTAHYDRIELIVFRLFAYEPGQSLSPRRLHFRPIPRSIPRERRHLTTIRLQHLSSLTEERRRARWRKYQESDPSHEWEPDYTYTIVPPGNVKPWLPRPPELPVLKADAGAAAAEWELAELDLEGPLLSVVVLAGPDDEGDLVGLVETLLRGLPSEPAEVLVIDAAGDGSGDLVRESHPSVTVVSLDPQASNARTDNLGLRAARGDYILFLRPGDCVDPGSLDAVAKAHDAGQSIVGGTAVNGSPSASGWISYFLDHAASLPGGPEGQLTVAPIRGSYPREAALRLTRPLTAGETTEQLLARGFSAVRIRGLTFTHHAPEQRLPDVLRERFRRGRTLERAVQQGPKKLKRRAAVRAGLVGVRPRLALIRTSVERSHELGAAYRRVERLVVAGLVATWAGAWYERSRKAMVRS